MQQYFAKEKKDDYLLLNEYDLNHIKNVMRIKVGDEVIVAYEGVSYLCEFCDNLLTCKIKNIYKEKEKTQIIAYIPILNEDKMDFVLEKGTEMGVTKFIPVEFCQCKFKLKSDIKEKKVIRWQKIVKEASEQSRRTVIPKVENIISIKNVDTLCNVNILCSTDNKSVKHISKVLTGTNIYDTISLIFGPEGGITKEEENILIEKGFIKTTLGNRILRTETVIIFVCSVIEYLIGGSNE